MLCDDDTLLDAGTVLALEQRGPEVRPDRLIFRIGRVEPDVKVGPEVPVLVLDRVHRDLERDVGCL